jgi:hypothetical protein
MVVSRFPQTFHLCQDAELVVDHYVVLGRIPLFDVIKHILFMNIDKHLTIDRYSQSRVLDLAGPAVIRLASADYKDGSCKAGSCPSARPFELKR